MSGGYPLGLELCNSSNSLSSPSRGTSVTGANGSYGSWVQIIASTTYDACWMTVRIWPTNGSSTRTFTQIGVGAGGSEVVLANDLYATSSTSGTVFTEYWFPVSVPAGTRLAARCQQNAAADANNVEIGLFDGSFTHMEGCGGVDSIGFVSGSTAATDIDPGGTINTKGAYSQLVASTAKDYLGVMISVGYNAASSTAVTAPALFDLAIGAGGSELVIVADYGWSQGGAISQSICPFIPVNIPAGTRVSARASQGANTVGSRVMGLIAYGVYM